MDSRKTAIWFQLGVLGDEIPKGKLFSKTVQQAFLARAVPVPSVLRAYGDASDQQRGHDRSNVWRGLPRGVPTSRRAP
jgi:hypothetical protein